jgi:hypothetical protein
VDLLTNVALTKQRTLARLANLTLSGDSQATWQKRLKCCRCECLGAKAAPALMQPACGDTSISTS